MEQSKRRWGIALGGFLCIITLILSIVLQNVGYLAFLNSDMSAEVILARQQAESKHIIETEWLYSTEIHTIHMNLLYAIAFLFTDSYALARIIGNTIGFLLGMGSYIYLCRKIGISYGRALCTAALLPLAASRLYAANVTVAGYYIVHLSLAFLGAGLWLDSAKRARRHGKGLWIALGFMAFCALEGSLSVRYVLCFVCPMLVTGVLDMLFAPEQGNTLRDEHARFFGMTVLGFMACIAGYVASEIIYPHVFTSGVGAASSFVFNGLDGQAMLQTIMVVFADFLKLLGWRGSVALFSLSGMINLCIMAMLVLGVVMTVRVLRRFREDTPDSRSQKRMLHYAAYAFLINMFCFVFIRGTYVNRYLIPAVIFFVPALSVVLQREKNVRLVSLFCFVLCMGLGASSVQLLKDTIQEEHNAQAYSEHMMEVADFLLEEGYSHGYGDFWDVRVMEELTQGALTFTGIAAVGTEQGAVSPVTLNLKRWLEMDAASDLDVCPGKTFLMLSHGYVQTLAPWLEMTGAPVIFENAVYRVYGFDSSQELSVSMLEGMMTLENANRETDGSYWMQTEGRLRMPPYWRESGAYSLKFIVEGDVQNDSVVQVYTTSQFTVLAEQKLTVGENELQFSLEHNDKYFMIQIRSGTSDGLRIADLSLDKLR